MIFNDMPLSFCFVLIILSAFSFFFFFAFLVVLVARMIVISRVVVYWIASKMFNYISCYIHVTEVVKLKRLCKGG